MKTYLIPILALALCGCSSFKEQSTESNPDTRYKEQRIEIVAKNLIKEGKAASMAEAKPLAETIVNREIAEQKSAGRENERTSNFFNEGDKRAE
jgi:hypothetical protein